MSGPIDRPFDPDEMAELGKSLAASAVAGLRDGSLSRPTCTVGEAAEALGVSDRSLYEAIKVDESPVPFIKVGHRIVIPTAGLKEILGMTEQGSIERAGRRIIERNTADGTFRRQCRQMIAALRAFADAMDEITRDDEGGLE